MNTSPQAHRRRSLIVLAVIALVGVSTGCASGGSRQQQQPTVSRPRASSAR